MKNICLLLLFSFACIALQSQEADRRPQSHPSLIIYFPPITGTGVGNNDREYFTGIILNELINQNFIVSGVPQNVDLYLTGSISSLENTTDEQTHCLTLRMEDNKTRLAFIYQEIDYKEPGEIEDLIKLTFHNIAAIYESFFSVPLFPEPEDAWRNKYWYFGAYFNWAPRLYSGDTTSVNIGNFSIKFSAEYQFNKNIILGTGVELTTDWVKVSDIPEIDFKDLILEVPLIVKYVIKPFRQYIMSPYTGPNFNFSLYRETKPALLSWILGMEFGIKFRKGMFVIDPRFSLDLWRSGIRDEVFSHIEYYRSMFYLGVGYKFGTGKVNEVLQ